jgi:hypothetical protein
MFLSCWLTSCPNNGDADVVMTGSIVIRLPLFGGKAPAAPSDIDYYELTLSGDAISEDQTKTGSPGEVITFDNLPEGNYSLVAHGYNSEDILIFAGSKGDIMVVAGQVTNVVIDMYGVSGSIEVSFNFPDNELECDDGIDNDGDGATDCDDADCSGFPGCGGGVPSEICDDGIDNDGDGATDCDDDDCLVFHGCGGGVPFETSCNDAVDNDGDGLVDCQDPDCVDSPECIPAL